MIFDMKNAFTLVLSVKAFQYVEKENAIVIFAQNYIKFASFKTFHRNVLKG